MKYLLNGDVALRSWQHARCGYIRKGTNLCERLDFFDFLCLRQCDGAHDLEDTPFLERMLRENVIRPARESEGLSDWQMYRDHDNPYFPNLNWMLTGRCNYNCKHCFNAADNTPLQSEWSLAEALRLLDEAEACGILCFTLTGGEPMLHPHFADICRGIHARNMYIGEINTNGYFITEETLQSIRDAGEPLPLMKISFDGLGHHDWMRGYTGAQERTLNAIRLCLDHGFRVMAQMNVHRGNVACTLPTLRELDGMGVYQTRVIRTSESPRWLENAPKMTLTPEEYFDHMLEMMGAYGTERHRMELEIWQFAHLNPLRQCYSIRAIACRDGEYTDQRHVCPDVRKMPAITAEGECVPCMQASGYFLAHGIHLGNVKKDGLTAVLNSSAYLGRVDRRLSDLKSHSPKCGACRWFRYCCGGCRALGLSTSGDEYHPDQTKCLFFEKGYYGKITGVMSGWKNLSAVSGAVKDSPNGE